MNFKLAYIVIFSEAHGATKSGLPKRLTSDFELEDLPKAAQSLELEKSLCSQGYLRRFLHRRQREAGANVERLCQA